MIVPVLSLRLAKIRIGWRIEFNDYSGGGNKSGGPCKASADVLASAA
jgi:hypothetical protein